uniref:NADH-ubiquinone oxidoreductase chain 5 n=1 Tax=Siphonosoma cumanense TaxID=6444 RepID=A0A7D4VB47_SIPCU|nr:NADH dehydrogenase subunit 5 [Siphonosoma cumanense]QKS32603.1 NADH dehydrogenase subunit 5 [Siphonosoma cumanense]
MSTRYSFLLYFLSLFTFCLAMFFTYNSKTLLFSWTFMNPLSTVLAAHILLDPMGLTFSAVVLFISANVLLFSTKYMSDEIFLPRFILLVLLFVLSMNFLIFIPNLMALLLGWDGLGLISFCLVIYYQNPKSLAGGMLTALSNRVGDVMILLSIAFLINQGHWLITHSFLSNNFNLAIIIMILTAGMTKSAQIPFCSWLPAAMAAPTPVSALVHSSTLVTAGVFLLIRFYPFLSISPYFNMALLLISSLTMLMAGMAAMMESDLKKIIALSTLSQLGIMMSTLAMGMPWLSFFHLLSHALFKALLFLTAGALIFLFSHNQDLRMVGNLPSQLPFITSAMLTANLALCGFPFLAGFYSKDLILEHALSSSISPFIVFLAMGGTLLTSAYSMRFMLTSIWAPTLRTPMHYSEEKIFFLAPMKFLSMGAITGGALINWTAIPVSPEPELLSIVKLLPFLLTLLGAYLIWSLSAMLTKMKALSFTMPLFSSSLTSMWFFTPISTQLPLTNPMMTSNLMFSVLDQGWWELVGPQGVPKATTSLFSLFQHWNALSPTVLLMLSIMVISPLPFLLSL